MKSKKRTLIWIACIVLAAAMLLTACQPTPDQPIVIGKDDTTLPQVSNENESNQSEATVNETWQDTIKSKDTVININAEVDPLNSLQTTQLQVKPAGFTVDQFKNFKDTLLGSKELFQYKDSNILTKAEIEALIIKTRQDKSTQQSGKISYYYYCDPITGEEMTLGADEYIEKLTKDYDSAPTTKDKMSVPMEFSDTDDGKWIYGMAELDNGNVAGICASNLSDNKNNNMYYYSNIARSEYAATGELESDTVNGVKMTKDEAIKTASDLIGKIKKDNEEFVFNKAYVGSYANDIKTENLNAPPSDDVLYDNTKQCFVLYFTRKYNEIETNYVKFQRETTGDSPEQSYQRIYKSQYIELYINDDGIIQVQWINPDEVTGNKDIQMLSFEKIKDIALKQIPLMNWSPDGKDIVINIIKVELGMMRIATKNKSDVYQVVPVWDFIGYIEGNQNSNYNLSMLTINAVDGSVIDRGLMY